MTNHTMGCNVIHLHAIEANTTPTPLLTASYCFDKEDWLLKIDKCFTTLEIYEKCYKVHREKVLEYFKNGLQPMAWEFSQKIVFARWDLFMERMNMIRVSYCFNNGRFFIHLQWFFKRYNIVNIGNGVFNVFCTNSLKNLPNQCPFC